ncbi:MAG: pilin [bacterium]|nr:pilin [bacterium]
MKKYLIFILLVILIFSVLGNVCFAVKQGEDFPKDAKTKDCKGTVCLTDPLKGATPQTLIGKIINAVLGIVGSIALLMFIAGGFTWMTAMGNKEKIQKGQDTLVWATIGLIIIFSAYALVNMG